MHSLTSWFRFSECRRASGSRAHTVQFSRTGSASWDAPAWPLDHRSWEAGSSAPFHRKPCSITNDPLTLSHKAPESRATCCPLPTPEEPPGHTETLPSRRWPCSHSWRAPPGWHDRLLVPVRGESAVLGPGAGEEPAKSLQALPFPTHSLLFPTRPEGPLPLAIRCWVWSVKASPNRTARRK